MVSTECSPPFVADLPKTAAALRYARRIHAGQLRQVDGAPFISHPLEVALLLHAAGAADDLIAAGILHDALEKTTATRTDLVCAVTEDDQVNCYARRRRLRHYRRCLGLLQEQLPACTLVAALGLELEALPDQTARKRTPAETR